MTWVAVAIGGSALIAGAASYAGAQKQASAAKQAANVSQQQAINNQALQQPFINSGYGALNKLNSLMGLSPNPNQSISSNQSQYAQEGSNASGPVQQLMPSPIAQPGRQNTQPIMNPQLRQILAIRANNGDAQANQILRGAM